VFVRGGRYIRIVITTSMEHTTHERGISIYIIYK
jgi:hypothetical protein